MSGIALEQNEEFKAIQAGIEVLSQSTTASDLCRRVAHAEFMDGFCHGVAIHMLDQRSVLVEVASYGKHPEFGADEIFAWDENVMAKAVRSRKIAIEVTASSTLYALPIELSGVTTGCFIFNLSKTVPKPIFSKQVTSMLSSLGGLFMDNKGISLAKVTSALAHDVNENKTSTQELTTRQLRIIELMADGLTNATIAKQVLLSESTVRQETIRIYRILNCHTRTEAIVKARALGLISRVPDNRNDVQSLAY